MKRSCFRIGFTQAMCATHSGDHEQPGLISDLEMGEENVQHFTASGAHVWLV